MAAEEDGPPHKKPRLRFCDHIEVLVGSAGKRFMLHKDVVTSRSPFFKAAVSERWNKPESASVELPEDDPNIFDMYLNCVYHDCVEVTSNGEFEDEEDIDDGQEIVIRRLTKTYVLADKLGDIKSCNIVISAILDKAKEMSWSPEGKTTRIAYEGTAEGSSLRKLLVDDWLFDVNSGELKKVGDKLPQPFLLDLAVKYERMFRSNHGGYGLRRMKTCYYHEHDPFHPKHECASRKVSVACFDDEKDCSSDGEI